jgi:hypothetical protein
MGKSADLLQKVFAQGATDAAIAHLNKLFFCAIEADIPLHLAAVDIDVTHVIDDNGDPKILTITQNVVQQRAFACAKKAGQDGNGKTVHEVSQRVCNCDEALRYSITIRLR